MKKKILVLANDTTYTYNLRDIIIKRFIENGYEIIIASEILDFKNQLEDLGCRLIDIKTNRHSKNPFSDIFLLNQYKRIIKIEKPDAVISYNIKPNIYGGIACRVKHIKFIPNITGLGSAVQNPGLVQKISTALYGIGVSKAYCVMFQNEDNKDYFIKSGLLGKHSKTCMLPGSGVNLEKFSYEPYPESSSNIIFSTIGRIMKDKGTDDLINAIRIVKKKYPNTEFRMIGFFDDDYEGIIRSAEKEGLIKYLGQQQDVRTFVKESHAIIQPSHHEGMSNVLLESAASGRPVIASNIPGCKETFDEGISGYGFEVENPESMADSIIKFIEIPYDSKVEMGIAGREKIRTAFDRNIVADNYIKIIEE